MPKIQWTDLPPALREHLFDRLRERKITVEDLYKLKLWRTTVGVQGETQDFSAIGVAGLSKDPHRPPDSHAVGLGT